MIMFTFPYVLEFFIDDKLVFNCDSIHKSKQVQHTWHKYNMISHLDVCFQSFVDPTSNYKTKLSDDPVTNKMPEKLLRLCR